MSSGDNRDSTGISSVREVAIWWSTRLHSGDISAQERAELLKWRHADPRNEQEFQAVERLGQAVSALPRNEVLALYGGPLPARPNPQRRRMLSTGLALACSAAAVTGITLLAQSPVPAYFQLELLTRKGERRAVELPDGSILQLNTDTAASVALFQDKRTVALHRGEIMFAVAADTARPFLVDADLGHVRVTGTQFDVRRDSDLLTVAVQSGRVEVSSGRWWRLDTQTLTAGQATSLDRNGIVREATPVDVSAITAWRDGRVVFRNTPLVEVIREINRYLEQPIRLTDPRLQRQRVTASFLLDDPEALIKSLPRVLNLQVRQLADGTLLLVSS